MTDIIITDPTLSAYHAPLTEAERIYFAAHYDANGELLFSRVVEPVRANAAELKIDEGKHDDN